MEVHVFNVPYNGGIQLSMKLSYSIFLKVKILNVPQNGGIQFSIKWRLLMLHTIEVFKSG